MTAKDLAQEQREWFIEHFPHTKNQELADRLGTSHRGVVRMARELGLRKTSDFMVAMQKQASEKAAKLNRLRGGNGGKRNLLIYGAPYRFNADNLPQKKMSKEELEDMHRRGGATRRELYMQERMRVRWGLEQKTNLRVTRCTPQKRNLRTNLRRRGYMIERASNDAYITDSTKRSAIMENHAEAMGISFYEYIR